MPTIAVTIVDQTVAVTQVGEIGPTGATGATGATGTVSAAGDGTAGAPGIAFASDTDTGFWRPGANTLAASTGGTERMRIAAGGSVGIGTTSPGNKLTVVDSSSGNQGVFQYGAGGRILAFGADGTGGRMQAYTAGFAGSAPLVLQPDGGNVGIGISSPVTKLANSATKTTSTVSDSGLNWNLNEAGTFAAGIKNASGTGKGLHLETGGGHALIVESGNVGIGTTAPDGKLNINSNTAGSTSDTMLRLTHNSSDTVWGLRIDQRNTGSAIAYDFIMRFGAAVDLNVLTFSNGNVGIGTIAPSAPLHTYQTGTGNKTGIILGRNTSNVGDLLSLTFNVADLGDQASIAAVPTGANAGDLVFNTRLSSALAEKMRITSTGNVGIGTSSVTSIFGTTVRAFNAGSGATLQLGGTTVNAYFYAAEGLGLSAIGNTTNTPFIFFTNDVERMRINAIGNIGFGTSDQFGGGQKVIGLANATTNPATNPTGGGVLYADAGALKWRGSSGTVTTIANA